MNVKGLLDCVVAVSVVVVVCVSCGFGFGFEQGLRRLVKGVWLGVSACLNELTENGK